MSDNRRNEVRKDKIKDLLLAGSSVGDIARKLGIHKTTVYWFINSYDLNKHVLEYQRKMKSDYIHRLTIETITSFLRANNDDRTEKDCSLFEYKCFTLKKNPLYSNNPL